MPGRFLLIFPVKSANLACSHLMPRVDGAGKYPLPLVDTNIRAWRCGRDRFGRMRTSGRSVCRRLRLGVSVAQVALSCTLKANPIFNWQCHPKYRPKTGTGSEEAARAYRPWGSSRRRGRQLPRPSPRTTYMYRIRGLVPGADQRRAAVRPDGFPVRTGCIFGSACRSHKR